MVNIVILPGGKPLGLFIVFYTIQNTLQQFVLFTVYDKLHLDVMLELNSLIKFIWTLLHSPNIIVKSVIRSAIRSCYSTVGGNVY